MFHLIESRQDSSQNIFKNYLWYKNIPTNTFEYNKIFQDQFLSSWHNFIDYRHIQQERLQIKNLELSNLCLNLINEIKNSSTSKVIIKILLNIKNNLDSYANKETLYAIDEVIILLKNKPNLESISNMKYFNSAFGRGQYYISFVKDSTKNG